MPRKAKPGDRIGGYEIRRVISIGGMAISYEARGPHGQKVFFKQYKSPTTTVAWYRGYIEYQSELKRRIEGGAAYRFCCKCIDSFEERFGGPAYFQAFEFISGNHDLEALLAKARSRPERLPWETRLTLAKVMLAGVNALHEAGIVHCDLKPANIQVFRDDSIEAKYRLKLIDMDFSVLADWQAPWHGDAGYVGSPNYFSPEHLSGPESVPQLASDVFTCGLILFELLTGKHPYAVEDQERYRKMAMNHKAPPPHLLGKMSDAAIDDDVRLVMHRCLSPDPARRPTARDVNLVLNGRLSLRSAPADARLRSDHPSAPAHGRTSSDFEAKSGLTLEPDGTGAATLVLTAQTGRSLRFAVPTQVGKHLCSTLDAEAAYFDKKQFVVERNAEGGWLLSPNLGAKNETMLNGRAVKDSVLLKDGDVLGVGRESKSIVKLPMVVHFE